MNTTKTTATYDHNKGPMEPTRRPNRAQRRKHKKRYRALKKKARKAIKDQKNAQAQKQRQLEEDELRQKLWKRIENAEKTAKFHGPKP